MMDDHDSKNNDDNYNDGDQIEDDGSRHDNKDNVQE